MGDTLGCHAWHYTEAAVPYTRIVEHKHFTFGTQAHTVLTREYPAATGEPYYPINDTANNARRALYQEWAKESGVIFGGRLGSWQYLNMDQTIGQALATFACALPT